MIRKKIEKGGKDYIPKSLIGMMGI